MKIVKRPGIFGQAQVNVWRKFGLLMMVIHIASTESPQFHTSTRSRHIVKKTHFRFASWAAVALLLPSGGFSVLFVNSAVYPSRCVSAPRFDIVAQFRSYGARFYPRSAC